MWHGFCMGLEYEASSYFLVDRLASCVLVIGLWTIAEASSISGTCD